MGWTDIGFCVQYLSNQPKYSSTDIFSPTLLELGRMNAKNFNKITKDSDPVFFSANNTYTVLELKIEGVT